MQPQKFSIVTQAVSSTWSHSEAPPSQSSCSGQVSELGAKEDVFWFYHLNSSDRHQPHRTGKNRFAPCSGTKQLNWIFFHLLVFKFSSGEAKWWEAMFSICLSHAKILEVPLHSLFIFQATKWQEFFLPYLHRNSELLIGLYKVTQLVMPMPRGTQTAGPSAVRAQLLLRPCCSF